MICWDRVGDHLVVGVFDRVEIHKLRSYLLGLGDLLDARFAGYSSQRTGTPSTTTHALDPRLRAVLRRRSPDGEFEVLRPLRVAIDTVLTTLPEQDGIVELHSADIAGAWTRALTDLGVAMAASARGEADPVVASRTRFTTRWLKSVVRTLDTTATKRADVVPQDLVDSVNQVRTFWI